MQFVTMLFLAVLIGSCGGSGRRTQPAAPSGTPTLRTVVQPPNASLRATPSTIIAGQSVILAWTSSNATSLNISPKIGAVAAPSGTLIDTPTATTTYTITAIGTGGAATSTVIVTVSSSPPTLSNHQLGWQELSNTRLASVCPPNLSYCAGVIGAWSGAVADTTRNRLVIWGGGHNDYYGNEVYALNLNVTPATLTRLNEPSPVNSDTSQCPTALSDGKPNSRHTYNGLAYLPTLDAMLAFGGAVACGTGSHWEDLWSLDLGTLQWTRKDPVNGATGQQPKDFYTPVQSYLTYNPVSGLVFVSDVSSLWSYEPNKNTYQVLNLAASVPYYSTAVLDPKRQLWIFFGNNNDGAPHVRAIDLSSTSKWTVQDWSSQVIGCDSLAAADNPGLDYDSKLDKIVGWPNFGNTVYVFDPDKKSCTTQTYSGGPPDSPDYNGQPFTTGTFGRFRYFPALDAFAVVNYWKNNAYLLRISP